ncbi:MAG: CBS domain-containing protein [Pseudomonadota bacterium]
MQVLHILKTKPDDAVVTVTPGTSVAQAAKVLADKRIGTVIVSADGERAAGILSERDIVRELGKRGAGVMQDRVETLMTADLVTCNRAQTADDVLTLMTNGRFRHMPVVEEGKLVGLISLGDVVKARLRELAHENDALQGMIMGH